MAWLIGGRLALSVWENGKIWRFGRGLRRQSRVPLCHRAILIENVVSFWVTGARH